jgi:hypothetical protein
MRESLKEMGLNKWEMLKTMASRCHAQFGMYLVEVSFWRVTLAHQDRNTAQEVVSKKRKEVQDILGYLFADTEV